MTSLQRVRETIGKVCGHLEEDRIRSEADVRSYILSPLLRDLGWDPADPGSVRREYAVTGGKSYFFDYALLAGSGAVAFVVEAKAPGKLDDAARDQLLLYAMKTKTRLGLTTDGKTWSFYLPLGGGTAEERLVRTVAFRADNAESTAGVFERYLARERVLSGQALQTASDDLTSFALHRVVRAGWADLRSGSNDKLVKTIAAAARTAATRKGATRAPAGRALNDAVREFIRSGFRFPDEGSGVGPEAAKPESGQPRAVAAGLPADRTSSARGRVAWTYRRERRIEKNVTEMYVAIVSRFYEDHGGSAFYARLQERIRGRKREMIAESAAGTGAPLTSVRSLPGGWHISTNLSSKAKKRYIRRACEAAGIGFGTDLVVEMEPRSTEDDS